MKCGGTELSSVCYVKARPEPLLLYERPAMLECSCVWNKGEHKLSLSPKCDIIQKSRQVFSSNTEVFYYGTCTNTLKNLLNICKICTKNSA
jgi:hypothetical protein